jgi:hypothetical protein
MKHLITLLVGISISVFTYAQTIGSQAPPVDKSPMDMSYCPKDYPVLKAQNKVAEQPLARIIYSRPQKNGRVVFGELIKYGELWRLGANEATEIDFYKDVRIDNKKIPKGKYTMYCIPTLDNWTIIFNKDNDTWGSFKYDSKKDVLRTNVKTTTVETVTESFSAFFEKSVNANTYNLVFMWDSVRCALPIKPY